MKVKLPPPRRGIRPAGMAGNRRTPMCDRIAQWQPDQGAAVAARAAAALALAALAVIHVVDLPGTLGPDRLVGIGYLGIIAAAVLIGGVLLAPPHRPGAGGPR